MIRLKTFGIEEKLAKIVARLGEFKLAVLNKFCNLIFVSFTLLSALDYPLAYFIKVLLASTLLWFLTELLKEFFERPRPYALLGFNIRTSTRPNKSFPSSHSATAFFLFLALRNSRAAPFLLLVPLLRFLTLQHWLSDVLLSMALGFLFYRLFAIIA